MDFKLKDNSYAFCFRQGWGNSIGVSWGEKNFPTKVGDIMNISGCKKYPRNLSINDYLMSTHSNLRMLFKIVDIKYQSNPTDLFFGKCELVYICNNEEIPEFNHGDELKELLFSLKEDEYTLRYA